MSEALPVHVTVVIPTRNEEAAIVDTIRSVPNDGWCEKHEKEKNLKETGYEDTNQERKEREEKSKFRKLQSERENDFLIIDGNSTDRTRELAEEEGASVYLEPRKGYGRAYILKEQHRWNRKIQTILDLLWHQVM